MIQKIASFVRKSPTIGRWSLRCLPDRRWTMDVKPVGPFVIRIRQNRSYWLRSPLTHDQTIFGAFQRLLRPGEVVYDIGANIGLYVRFLVQHFQAGRVVAFEPIADTFALLKTNIGKNAETAARTTLLNLAVGDVDSEEKFQVDDMSSASSVLDRVMHGVAASGRRQYGLKPRTEIVKVVKLDTIIPQKRLPPPELIKVDIEGAAALALAGMSQTLDKYHPDMIVETHGIEEAASIFTALTAHGYHCFGFAQRNGSRGYFELEVSDIKPVDDFWQPHHIFASIEPEKLREKIQPHHCWMS